MAESVASHPAVEHHLKAAETHERTAQYHRSAAESHEQGRHEEAHRHSQLANDTCAQAADHSTTAHQASAASAAPPTGGRAAE